VKCCFCLKLMLPADSILQNRYRIIELLGQGGMGAVYQAIDQRLDTTVALKECFFSEEALRRQFEREARLLARLRHPAMTRVIDHFTEGDGQFLVMEFIPGSDLFEMLKLKGAPFTTDEVLKWGDQLLDALDYLHNQEPQIIHRDIKPQNLKLIKSGQIILLDFGLAKSLSSQASSAVTSASILGYTPSYAPLEQIQSGGTDRRSDLYSLAATLYHLMTGAMPPGALTRATAVLNNEPDPLRPPQEINPRVTPEVSSVLMQAMALERERRPSSAEQMRRALSEAAQSRTTSSNSADPNALTNIVDHGATIPQQQRKTIAMSSPSLERTQQAAADTVSDRAPTEPTVIRHSAGSPSRKSKTIILIAAAVIVLIVIAAVALIVNRNSTRSRARKKSTTADRPPAPQKATSNVAPVKQTLTGHTGEVKSVAFSPDGELIASGSADGIVNLWDSRTGAINRTFREPDSEVVAVSFSTGGKVLAFAVVGNQGKGSVSFVDSNSGRPIRKIEEDNINAIALSPDGQTLAIGNISGSLRLWDVNTGETKLTLEGQDIQTRSVAFSPDGKLIAAGGYGNTVKLWDAKTGVSKHPLEGHDNEIGSVAFSPDGKTIASGSEDDTVKLWDVDTGTLKRTLTGFDLSAPVVAFSPDGKLLAATANHSVMLFETQTGTLKLTLDGGSVNSIAFSPDGKTLAGASDKVVKLWDVSDVK